MKITTSAGLEIRPEDALVTIREVCCRREKQHNPDPLVRANSCDGIRIVCGKCDNTARMILRALDGERS